MEDYSPSHPTDQDAEGDSSLPAAHAKIAVNEENNSHIVLEISSTDHSHTVPAIEIISKSPELSPTLSGNSSYHNEYADIIIGEPKCDGDTDATVVIGDNNSVPQQSVSNPMESKQDKESTISALQPPLNKATRRSVGEKDTDRKSELSETNNSSSKSDGKYRSGAKSKTPYKESDKSNRHSNSKSSRNHSRSPRHKKSSRSPDRRNSRRRSSSKPRHSHSRRRSRTNSRDRDRRYRRSRSGSRDRRDRRRRDSYRDRHERTSRSNGRNEKPSETAADKHLINRPPVSDSTPFPVLLPKPSIPPPPILQPAIPVQHFEEQYDMDETSTPNINEENTPAPPMQSFNESVAFMLRNHPPPPPPPLTSAPNILNWQQQQGNRPALSNQLIANAFHRQQHPMRHGSFVDGFPPRPDFRDLPPNLMSQRPTFNPADRFPGSQPPPPPPHPQLMTMNGILNPLLSFGGLLGQPPPSLPYVAHPPPPPFLHRLQQNARLTFHPPLGDVPLQHPPPQATPPNPQKQKPDGSASSSNLLETLMSKAGLPTDGLHGSLANTLPSSSHRVPSIPLPEIAGDKSPMKKLNKLLNTAATTLLTRLNLSGQQVNPVPGGAGNTSPLPPPPPPLPMPPTSFVGLPQQRLAMPPGIPFVPPPLPTIPNGNESMRVSSGDAVVSGEKVHKPRLEYDVQEMLVKRRRSEFENTREWQERIALEVKSFMKPFYAGGRISKEDFRTILKKSVNKISRSRCTSIDTKKIGDFVKLYIDRYYKYRKWQAKQKQKREVPTSAPGPPLQ